MTIRDAFAAPVPAAVGGGSPAAVPDKARVHARMRARGYRSLPVVGKVAGWWVDWAVLAWADLRAGWWTPTSLPTVSRAWAERTPDRELVPGDNALLYGGWVVYNHTLGLAVPALAVAVVGLLASAVWVFRHPARLVLAAVIVTAFTALIFS